MTFELTWIVLFSFIAVFFSVIGCAAVLRMIVHPVEGRVERLRPGVPTDKGSMIRPEFNEQSMVASLGQRMAPKDPNKRSLSRQRLAMAGYYNEAALYYYWGIKMVSTLIPPMVTLAFFIVNHIPLNYALLPCLAAFGLGLLAPDFYLYIRKQRRQEQIFRGLPDALDLLLVCVEAGLGLDASLQKVSEEIQLSCRVLSEELQLTCTAIRFGQERNEALHELGERTGVLDLRSLMSVLIQADRFGVSIGQALRVHSDDMRTRRRQRAEEMAAKTTVKLIFPLVLFIFPAIFVVLGGPAVIRIMENLMNK